MHDAVLIQLCDGDLSHMQGESRKRLRLLDESARQAGRPVVTVAADQSGIEQLVKHLPCLPVLCGIASLKTILKVGSYLRSLGVTPLVPIDALMVIDQPDKLALTNELAAQRFHIALTDGVQYLFQVKERYVYAYPKPDVSASLVLLLEPSNRVVLVRRKYEPYKGMFCVPGGFLEPLAETLELCASREFMEEAGVWIPPDRIELLTVQSDPSRDPRGHVINHVFFASMRDDAGLQFHAGDDASEVQLVPIQDALKMSLASDCRSVMLAVDRRIKRQAPVVSHFFDNITPAIAEDLSGWSSKVRPS